MRDDERIYLYALCSLSTLGPVTERRLLRAFGSAKAVFERNARDLMSVEGISQKRAESIGEYRDFEQLDKTISELESQGVSILTEQDDAYPVQLGDLGDYAPVVLYTRGEVEPDDKLSVAIVGSRKATRNGLSITERLSTELTRMGFSIVSGMARGVDTVAHRGCMKQGGRTLAVLGCGIDVVYPPENRELMYEIASSGAVISEFAPGTRPMRENFPRRNRLISGLSMGIIVTEAAKRSGALITAGFALEQGKEVFAVPGSIDSPLSAGPNTLIQQGARLLSQAEDVVAELAPQLKVELNSRTKKPALDVSGDEKTICDIMNNEPRHVDEITRLSGVAHSKALAALLGLELKGIVRQLEGMHYHLI